MKSIYFKSATKFERNHPLRYYVYYFRARIHKQNTNHSASEAVLNSKSPNNQTKSNGLDLNYRNPENQTNLNGLTLSSRNPDLPVTSLPGPPVPPRSYSQIHLDTMQQNSMYSTLFKLFWLNKTVLSRATAKIFSSQALTRGSTLSSQDYSPSSVVCVPKPIRAIWRYLPSL